MNVVLSPALDASAFQLSSTGKRENYGLSQLKIELQKLGDVYHCESAASPKQIKRRILQ
jgi:hypothetical protein